MVSGEISDWMHKSGEAARSAARLVARASTGQKNAALEAMAQQILSARERIGEANAADLKAARSTGLSGALLDRLELTPARIDAMAQGLAQIARLPDPVGEISGMSTQPSGISVGRMRVPLGVIGIIYESRPNVTADAAGLCLKSGNAAILRGGSEALNSNRAIGECLSQGLADADLPASAIQVLQTADRAVVSAMLTSPQFIDVIVPRGGKSLIEKVSAESQVPVIKHLDGNCHVFIDDDADLLKAVDIAFNAKCRRYGICGAMETLLLGAGIAAAVLEKLLPRYREAGVNCGAVNVPALWRPSVSPRVRLTGRANFLPRCWPCALSILWTRRWTISRVTAPGTQMPSSRITCPRVGVLCARLIPVQSWSMRQHNLPMVLNMAWVRKSASVPTSCMCADRLGLKG